MDLKNVELPSNYKFGLFFTAVFTIISYFVYEESITASVAIAATLAVTTLVVTLLSPDKLLPFNRAWMKFGLFLGMIISPIILGLIFFVLITPVALVMKLAGRDELRLKMAHRQSDWKERQPAGPDGQSFKNQF